MSRIHRLHSGLVGIVLVLLAATLGESMAGAQEASQVRVGVFDVDASPPIGSPLAYVPNKEVLTPLSCRGLVILGRDKPIVLCAIEFQSEPDPNMFSRLMVYLGLIHETQRPSDNVGDRFAPMGVVVNLTGEGQCSRRYLWAPGAETTLQIVEWNLSTLEAGDFLTGVETGQLPLAALAFVPLMKSGEEEGIIDRWKSLARQDENTRRRADHALAMVLAEAAKRQEVWREALEGWNVQDSQIVAGWINEGRQEGIVRGREEGIVKGREEGIVRGQQELLKRQVRTRFKELPEDIDVRLSEIQDTNWLSELADLLI